MGVRDGKSIGKLVDTISTEIRKKGKVKFILRK